MRLFTRVIPKLKNALVPLDSKCNSCARRKSCNLAKITVNKFSAKKFVAGCEDYEKVCCENCANGRLLSKHGDRPNYKTYIRCRKRSTNVDAHSLCRGYNY